MTKIMDIKSLLIGFLLATSAMLFMGAAEIDVFSSNSPSSLPSNTGSDNGRYQISTSAWVNNLHGHVDIYETIIDTKNGKIKSRNINKYQY